ncbi:MAG: glycosyltransferase family 4 protein [Planctomycetaceae bacterium]|nr:glycosyltransferase family 4 protein [Planctomycetaceae bacterium]
MQEPTIVFVCASSSAFVAHHLPLAAKAAERCQAHAVLTIDDERHLAIIRRKNITVHAIPIRRKTRNPLRVLNEVRTLRRILNEINPDVIDAINLKSVLVAALANAGRTARLIGTVTGLGYLFTGESVAKLILSRVTLAGLRMALARQDHCLIHSNRDDLEVFLRARVTDPHHMHTVPVPGIDTMHFRFTHEPDCAFRIVLPSRMLWDKGVGEFVEAAAMVRDYAPKATFILAGEPDPGNPSSIPIETLRAWADEGLVTWNGRCDDMPSLFASCHAVCLPSYYREGFPRVLAEAMACGRPIVTTNVPGCRNAVGDANTGILVPPRDATALAEAIYRLYGDASLRMEMGKNGRLKAERELSESFITRTMLGYLIPGGTQ